MKIPIHELPRPYGLRNISRKRNVIWTLIILISCLCISCQKASHKSELKLNTAQSISLQIFFEEPYCGGANRNQPVGHLKNLVPMAHEIFYIEKLEIDRYEKENLVKVKTDTNGVIISSLENGNYALYSELKINSFNLFHDHMRSKNMKIYKDLDKGCFKKWWQTPDKEFLITNSSISERDSIVLKKACYVGFNQCIKYIGPIHR